LVSTAAYAWLFGWQFGIGFVLLILVHEMGHAIQLRREGVEAGWPVFIPFLGAYIGMKEMPKDAAAEARVGLAGPVLGSIGCLVPLALYAATGNDLFRALAYIGFFLNLFNLLPILPLDGGRAMAAVSPIFWALGMALIVAATILFPSPIILLIVLFGGLETWRRWKARKSPESKAYHDVSRGTRLAVGAVYLSLALLLAVGIHFTHFTRTFSSRAESPRGRRARWSRGPRAGGAGASRGRGLRPVARAGAPPPDRACPPRRCRAGPAAGRPRTRAPAPRPR